MTTLNTAAPGAAPQADCFCVSRTGLSYWFWACLKALLSGMAYAHGMREVSSRMATDLDDRILLDIGAPPWLMAQAQQRREAQAKHVHDMLRF